MKHGIYIIRSAFKRCHFHFSIDQCLQKSAGNQSFATAAGSCCKKYSWNIHPCSPLFLSYIFSTISGHSNLLTCLLYTSLKMNLCICRSLPPLFLVWQAVRMWCIWEPFPDFCYPPSVSVLWSCLRSCLHCTEKKQTNIILSLIHI